MPGAGGVLRPPRRPRCALSVPKLVFFARPGGAGGVGSELPLVLVFVVFLLGSARPVPRPVPHPIPSHAARAPAGFLGFFWSFCCIWVKGKSRGRGWCRVRFAGMRSPSRSTSPRPGAEQGCGRSILVLVPTARSGVFAAARGTRLARGPGVTAENGSLMVVPKEKEKKQKKGKIYLEKTKKKKKGCFTWEVAAVSGAFAARGRAHVAVLLYRPLPSRGAPVPPALGAAVGRGAAPAAPAPRVGMCLCRSREDQAPAAPAAPGPPACVVPSPLCAAARGSGPSLSSFRLPQHLRAQKVPRSPSVFSEHLWAPIFCTTSPSPFAPVRFCLRVLSVLLPQTPLAKSFLKNKRKRQKKPKRNSGGVSSRSSASAFVLCRFRCISL